MVKFINFLVVYRYGIIDIMCLYISWYYSVLRVLKIVSVYGIINLVRKLIKCLIIKKN